MSTVAEANVWDRLVRIFQWTLVAAQG